MSFIAVATTVAMLTLSTDRPIIAVWAHPVTESGNGKPDVGEYIAASYVKWIESAGGRVIPVRYNATDAEVDTIFEGVNGVLFPGGGVDRNAAATRIFHKALAANDAGDYFPVWGTCLGFEWLMQMVAEDNSVVTPGFDSENITIALDLTQNADSARMFYGTSGEGDFVRNILSNKSNAVPLNAHSLGVTPKDFEASAKLTSFFKVLSTNKDRNGKEFVSTIEAMNYPVYSTQWHPERNAYEWAVNPQDKNLPLEPCINHSPAAMKGTQALADFFISEARKSTHKFPNQQTEWNKLIWHYPLISGDTSLFSQAYLISP